MLSVERMQAAAIHPIHCSCRLASIDRNLAWLLGRKGPLPEAWKPDGVERKDHIGSTGKGARPGKFGTRAVLEEHHWEGGQASG